MKPKILLHIRKKRRRQRTWAPEDNMDLQIQGKKRTKVSTRR